MEINANYYSIDSRLAKCWWWGDEVDGDGLIDWLASLLILGTREQTT